MKPSCPFKVRGHIPPQMDSHVPLQIFDTSWFWKQLPKDKQIVNNMCYIWYNHIVSFMIRMFSASNHQLLNSNLRSLALSQRQTRLYSSGHYLLPITHDSVELINAMTYQRRSDESDEFRAHARWLNSLAHQKQSAEERYPFHSSNSFRNDIWEFLRQKSW